MKIIISPTKTMKRKNYIKDISEPIFLEKSRFLRKILKTYNKEKIKKDFKVSDNLTKKVYEFYNNEKEPIAAINLYEGLTFKSMDIALWDKSDFDFVNNHLLIMSAMYGLLSPSDAIIEYRLDYVMPFMHDLYDFWSKPINDLLKDEDLIINLASLEFSKQIDHPNMINMHFLDEKGRNLSTQAKKGRGDMLGYIVKNKIVDVKALKLYNNLDYKFRNDLSDKNNYYFSKE